MNKLNELIHTLCPKGVIYRELREISEMKRGTSVTKKDITVGDIPVISGGKDPAYFCDTFNRSGETITVAGSGAGAGFVQYWTIPIFVCDAFTVKGCKDVSTKYLYYCLTNMQERIYSTKKGGGVPHVHISSIETFKIPVPPLVVQDEIVRILDNFTELTAALTVELTAELTARNKQYEYYREKILSRTNDAEQYALQDIVADCCSISYGIVQTGDDVENGIPVVRPVDLADKTVSLKGLKRVAPSIAESYKRTILQGGDLLLCVRGTTGVISIASDELKGCNVSRGIVPLTFKSTVCPQYIYYQFLSQGIQKEIESKTRGAALKQINMEDLRQIRFPVPTLEVQQQIVSILDRFDALCDDITSGLSAEIEARQKQYEYYRDKLLTFKQLC